MPKARILPTYNSVKPDGFYVYIHRRADSGVPFYVGKGKGVRGWKLNRNQKWVNIEAKHGATIEICQSFMSEEDAFFLEEWLIAKFRHEGNNLANLTNGGDGISGLLKGPTSMETKIKMRNFRGGQDVYCSNGMVFRTGNDAAKWAGGCSGPILQCCKGLKLSAYGFAWSYLKTPAHPLLTGRDATTASKREAAAEVECDEHGRFRCVYDAVIYLRNNGKPRAVATGIYRSADGKRLKAYGCVWRWVV